MVVFVYSHPKPEMLEHDGLMTAVRKLGWNEININGYEAVFNNTDILVGWGPFGGDVDQHLKRHIGPKALCMSAYMEPVHSEYDVVFYETSEAERFLKEKGCTSKLIHAFGVDTDFWEIMPGMKDVFYELFDYITVGGWNNWHRYEKCLGKKGLNIAVGGMMRENMQQSASLMLSLALDGWVVSDEVTPERLRDLYLCSEKAYLPAEFGQERAVLEARAMGLKVEVESDNPKLMELLESPIYDVPYYMKQLKEGVEWLLAAE